MAMDITVITSNTFRGDLNKGECDLNQSKDGKRVAKKNN